jgi:pimeloyl-ACP methyl ester carboxylesterase
MSERETGTKQEDAGALLGKAAAQIGEQSAMLLKLAQRHGEAISQTYWTELQRRLGDLAALAPHLSNPAAPNAFRDYLQDCTERWILFLDTLRQRGNAYLEREKEGFKPVLVFDYEIIVDGRKLERPVNYALASIQPPADCPAPRHDARPFVIIDPRAGHGSGIGGFKAESEVGVALKDGHPVYFVIFFPQPEPGQTLADVCAAEARFLEDVHARHPKAPAPLVIGNCQGGWASMILAATHPGLTGPIVIAGAPLSYWAGEMGKNPFRYLGGLLGGAVPSLLASDLGQGKFDGASLVLNFEHLNPGKTWWRKYYDVFANVDRDAGEFLRFENWWSGFYFMNENEIRWIVENLFVGNKLARGEAVLNGGTRIDLTKIKAPIVVFASHGDNITPPQQALNWIADLHDTVDEIKARGHVIVYTLHDSIGHLGIFVSAKVATKQHKEITSVVKTIEALAPGLYEMEIKDGGDGLFEVSFEARTIDDILALDDGREEEAEFAAVAKMSEWATRTYELMMRPAVRAMVTPELAKALVDYSPMRQQRSAFSDHNPLMSGLDRLAAQAREHRKPAGADNPFLQLERLQADLIEQAWNLYRDSRDAFVELTFHSLYGTPWMRSVAEESAPPHVSHDILQFPEVKQAIEKAASGGYREAIIRMLVLLARARGSVRRDRLERSNRMLHARPPFDSMTQEDRNALIYEQSLIVQFAPDEALASLPQLLKDDVDRYRAINLVLDIAGPVEEMDATTITMFKRLQGVLRMLAHEWREPDLPQMEAGGETAGPEAEAASKHPFPSMGQQPAQSAPAASNGGPARHDA